MWFPNRLVDPTTILGGHATTIIGIVTGQMILDKFKSSNLFSTLSQVVPTDKFFKVRNSWGESFGDCGDYYLRVSDFLFCNINTEVPGCINTLMFSLLYVFEDISIN